MAGTERRRRRVRRPETNNATNDATAADATSPSPAPSPSQLAELSGTFALTSAGQDVRPPDEPAPPAGPPPVDPTVTDPRTERGLRNLVGGGSSQVSISAALRARDAARPTDADLARAETELAIIRRGWVPREDLPPRGKR